MICFLCEVKDVDASRRSAILYFDENQPGHHEQIEQMLPTPVGPAAALTLENDGSEQAAGDEGDTETAGGAEGVVTHWMCLMRNVHESMVATMKAHMEKYKPPL